MGTVSEFRLTQPALKVLRFFLGSPSVPRSGAEIAKATRVLSGTLYPMLIRMEKWGWVRRGWEEIDSGDAGRPRRRFYELTANGRSAAVQAFAELKINVEDFSWAPM